MSDGLSENESEFGALGRNIRIRILNCSAGGCLLESDVPLALGTFGRLRISLGAQTFSDTVEIVRCQAIAGGRGVHHIGARLLPMTPASRGTLRHAMNVNRASVTGWLTTGARNDASVSDEKPKRSRSSKIKKLFRNGPAEPTSVF